MNDTELIDLLNTLLEAERAGAKVAAAWEAEADAALRRLLGEVKRDEARFSAMLGGLVQHHGGTPSRATGAFHEKALSMGGPMAERLAFLNRGQAWVIRRLREALPHIPDAHTRGELQTMLDVHEANVARCDAVLAGATP
jgi:hypothetical protein